MLAVQALLAVATFEVMRTRVLVAVASIDDPALILDVWGPLALIAPMLFFLKRVETSAAGAGWVAFGAPVAIGLAALAGTFLIGSRRESADRGQAISLQTLVTWSSAGIVLLMLGAAHDLTLWIGQCAFAGAAVLLWINTPSQAPAEAELTPAHVRAGNGVSIALVLAIGQGAVSLAVPDRLAPIGGAIMVASAILIVLAAAAIAGPMTALRLGGWSATLGVLFALGALTLFRLLPHAWMAMRDALAHGEGVPMMGRIASGFGRYALEALLLMLLPAAVYARSHLAANIRWRVGAAMLVAVAFLAAWRLAAI